MSRYVRNLPFAATSSGNMATTASSGGGAHGVVTLAAPASSGISNILGGIVWSYLTAPTSGGLNVYDGTSSGALMMSLDITGVGPEQLDVPLRATPGNALTVELLQGGSSGKGKVQAYGYQE